MTKGKKVLYFHQPTGSIMWVTKAQARKLNKDWRKVEFVNNDKGEPVMRFTFIDGRGNRATVDVKDNGEQEVVTDGDGDSK